MALLLISANQCTILAGFSECINWKGRGDRNCTSVPTLSRLLARWFLTELAIASSFRPGLPFPCAPLEDCKPALYAYRLGGALVWPWMSTIIVSRDLPVCAGLVGGWG